MQYNRRLCHLKNDTLKTVRESSVGDQILWHIKQYSHLQRLLVKNA